MAYRVEKILRYPVKSMQGEALESAYLTERGLPLDRGWAVKSERTSNLSGAKQFGQLLYCSARYLPETNAGAVPHVAITLPNGETISTEDERVHQALSDLVGEAVKLWPLQPKEDAEHYRLARAADYDMETDLRAIFALQPDEPLPDLAKFPEAVLTELLEFASPRGTYFDAFPLNILTRASIRHLQSRLPSVTIDERRFRPNILLEDDENASRPAEFDWVGQKLSLGEAVCEIEMECPRCVMATRDQPGLENAPEIMRTLVKELSQNLSVYAVVEKEGLVRAGDTLSVG